MGEQLVISISREFGSGGHEIAAKLAERLDLVFYDRSMLDEIAAGMNADAAELHKYDEKPTNRLLSRRVGNHTNSCEEIIAQFQFDYIRKKAESGESFVVVGRCSETVLKDYDCLMSVFVTGDKEQKIQRVMERYDISESDAYSKMRRHDKSRKQYHNKYSDFKWGDARYYDMCINSSPLGVDKTVNVLENYVKERTRE